MQEQKWRLASTIGKNKDDKGSVCQMRNSSEMTNLTRPNGGGDTFWFQILPEDNAVGKERATASETFAQVLALTRNWIRREWFESSYLRIRPDSIQFPFLSTVFRRFLGESVFKRVPSRGSLRESLFRGRDNSIVDIRSKASYLFDGFPSWYLLDLLVRPSSKTI